MDHFFDLFGLVLVICWLVALIVLHYGKNNPYELSDLVTTRDHMDLAKVGQLTALLATTWVLIHMELRSSTAEWYAGLYMLAWVGAQFGSVFARIKSPPQLDQGPKR